MDSRRRSVMQPSGDPYGNRSHIPVPSTIKKSVPNPRMSLAGAALRAPNSSLTLNVPGSTSRPSMMRSQNVNPLLASATKPNYGRTPLHNSVRRGSIWGGGATMPPPGSQGIKDPRPLRDRQYQGKMRQEISVFLQSSGFDIAPSTLTNIQGKEYRAIFEFLVLNLDPSFPLGQTGRFEDDFQPALKALRYPYAHSMDNKWLAAPASMHSWPSLLGVLHWLVEMCKLREEYFASNHPTLQDPSLVQEEFEDPFEHQALAFQYFENAYEMWLDQYDEFIEPNQNLESRYAKKTERVQNVLLEQRNLLDAVNAELKKLKSSEPPLKELKRANETLIRDREKFLVILKRYEGRKEKLKETIAHEKAELVTLGTKLENLKSSLQQLADIVKEQNLSPEEVIQMNNDQEQLSRSLEELRQRISETHKNVLSLEVTVSNRSAAAEESLENYSNLLLSLELYQLPSPWQDINLNLELNTASSNPQGLLSGADTRTVVKPTLSAIAESNRIERADLESEKIRYENELDKITQECENLDEEILELEKKVLAVNEQAEDIHEAAQQEAMIVNEQAERLERELSKARSAAYTHGLGVRSELNTLQVAYKEQIAKVSRLKEETVRAIIKNSHEIAMFKEEVSRHLTELREFAETE